MIKCPKCNFEQPQDEFCAQCGVNMARLEASWIVYLRSPWIQFEAFLVTIAFCGFLVFQTNFPLISQKPTPLSLNTKPAKSLSLSSGAITSKDRVLSNLTPAKAKPPLPSQKNTSKASLPKEVQIKVTLVLLDPLFELPESQANITREYLEQVGVEIVDAVDFQLKSGDTIKHELQNSKVTSHIEAHLPSNHPQVKFSVQMFFPEEWPQPLQTLLPLSGKETSMSIKLPIKETEENSPYFLLILERSPL